MDDDAIWNEVRRRARQLQNDRLPSRNLAPGEISDLWWEHVLRDFRARQVDPRGAHQRVFHTNPAAKFAIVCGECRLRKEVARAEVLRQFGADYMLRYLPYDLALCPKDRRQQECGARLAVEGC